MAKYVSLINLRLRSFTAWRLEHVSRISNENVDAFVAIVVSLPIKETVLLPVYYQPESSISTNRVNEVYETGPTWINLIVRYLSLGEFLDNRAETNKIQLQTARFSLINGQLYKRPLAELYLKCLTQ